VNDIRSSSGGKEVKERMRYKSGVQWRVSGKGLMARVIVLTRRLVAGLLVKYCLKGCVWV
jgi:hypothetical protein